MVICSECPAVQDSKPRIFGQFGSILHASRSVDFMPRVPPTSTIRCYKISKQHPTPALMCPPDLGRSPLVLHLHLQALQAHLLLRGPGHAQQEPCVRLDISPTGSRTSVPIETHRGSSTSGSRLFSFSSGARNSLCGQGVRSGVTSGETSQ